MNITIWHEREQREENVSFSGKTIAELLRLLSINPEVVLVVRNKEVLTLDQPLKNHDRVELLSVISGG